MKRQTGVRQRTPATRHVISWPRGQIQIPPDLGEGFGGFLDPAGLDVREPSTDPFNHLSRIPPLATANSDVPRFNFPSSAKGRSTQKASFNRSTSGQGGNVR